MKPLIICFEGPSAVGKTTLSDLFSESYKVIPEVNLLFDKTEADTKYWYYKRQIERYQMCINS